MLYHIPRVIASSHTLFWKFVLEFPTGICDLVVLLFFLKVGGLGPNVIGSLECVIIRSYLLEDKLRFLNEAFVLLFLILELLYDFSEDSASMSFGSVFCTLILMFTMEMALRRHFIPLTES